MAMKKQHIVFRTIVNRQYIRQNLAYQGLTIGFIEIYFN
jgi:hypothetical protein